LALGALRRRLRLGVDAPGAPLPINLIAGELRLSSTPVREALSRLAGEDLVEKRGPTYTRPRLDGPTLAELYGLRLLYLVAATAPDAERRARRRQGPSRPPIGFTADLAGRAHAPSATVEALFLELVLGADDLMLAQAYQRTAERLAPFQPIEGQVFPDLASEAVGLMAVFEAGRGPALRAAVRLYHRRRIAGAPALARLAGEGKYRPDIV
jgi:DNA-binding Lrp family transcriptional regulator